MMNRRLIYFILIISSVFNFVKLTKDILDVNEKLLQNIGRSLLARSSSDPTIISLNIINLAIVFVLKAIMYGAAWIGKYIPDRLYDRRRFSAVDSPPSDAHWPSKDASSASDESWLSKDASASDESWLSKDASASDESWLSNYASSTSDESWLSEAEVLLLLSYLLLDKEDPAILQVACCHPRQTQRYLNVANLLLSNLYDDSNAESLYRSSLDELQRAVDIGFGEEAACSTACANLLMK